MNLILLLGSAHGGSTITNMMLGQHPDVFSAGTLKGFPDNGQIVADNLCACGAASTECSFWRRVTEDLAQSDGNSNHDTALVQSILKHSGKQFVVDVSHGLSRLGELANLDEIQLHVVYVRRPLRGVVFSQVRKSRERGEYQRAVFDFVYHTLRVGRSWHTIQHISERFCRKHGIPYSTISYDLMCKDPEAALQDTGELLGLDYSRTGQDISAGKALAVPPHLIRGNKKLRAHSEIYLREDKSYLKQTALMQRLLAGIGVVLASVELLFLGTKRIKKIEMSE